MYDKFRQQILKTNKMSKVLAIGNRFGVKLGNTRDINKAKKRVLNAIEKEAKEIEKGRIKREQKFAIGREKKKKRKLDQLYKDVINYENKFRKSYEKASNSDKLLFLEGKTLQYTDKYSFTAPIKFHNIKNRTEFDSLMNSYSPEYRETWYNDYLNKLRLFRSENNASRMLKEFTNRLPGLYRIDDDDDIKLTSAELKDESKLIANFKGFSYIKQREILSRMDEQHYQIRVESEIKKGASRPESVERVLYEVGFSDEDNFIPTE